jgi:hypothetical protein
VPRATVADGNAASTRGLKDGKSKMADRMAENKMKRAAEMAELAMGDTVIQHCRWLSLAAIPSGFTQ